MSISLIAQVPDIYVYIYIYIWLLRSGELIWKKRNRRKALKIFLSVHLKGCSSLIGLHLKELGELRNQEMYSLQARGHEWYRGERGNANGTGKYKIYNKKNQTLFIHIISTQNVFDWKFMGPVPER